MLEQQSLRAVLFASEGKQVDFTITCDGEVAKDKVIGFVEADLCKCFQFEKLESDVRTVYVDGVRLRDRATVERCWQRLMSFCREYQFRSVTVGGDHHLIGDDCFAEFDRVDLLELAA